MKEIPKPRKDTLSHRPVIHQKSWIFYNIKDLPIFLVIFSISPQVEEMFFYRKKIGPQVKQFFAKEKILDILKKSSEDYLIVPLKNILSQ